MIALVIHVLLACPADPAPATRPSGSEPLFASVTGTSELEPVVAIDRGRRHGIAMGDAAAVVRPEGPARVVATGEVFLLQEDKAALRLTARPESSLTGLRAIVIPSGLVAAARTRMPEPTTVAGTIQAVGPGRRQAWIDRGGHSGLAPGDRMLVTRDDFPIAVGRLALVTENTALLQCRSLVSNALPQEGDEAELWPSPAMRRTGRLETMVMEVRPDPDGSILRVAGGRSDGLAPERILDLFAGSEYVGMAGITAADDRLATAKAMRAFCTTRPTVGLRAVARPPAGASNARLEARVFDVRENYALISAGRSDGVLPGQTFAVIRNGQVVARLEVKVVEVDFAGAQPLPRADGATPAPLNRWDVAVREPVPESQVETLGTVAEVARAGDWVRAVGQSSRLIRRGDVLRVATEPPSAAIVADVAGFDVLVYIPPGWGRGTIRSGQTLERTVE